jgi:hypothetical protein
VKEQNRMMVSQVDNLKDSPAIPPGSAMMAMFFNDASPVILCLTELCGQHFHGDAAVDAWRAWYRHLAEKHPGWGE